MCARSSTAPGPVVHTVAVVGYAAAGIGGGLLAAAVAFAPSFSFILIGAERFDRLRANQGVRAFLDGAGPAAIGAIAGAAIPLALALDRAWQFAVLAALVAFAPSFSFILIGADRFDRLRANERVRSFLDGAGPAAIGAIAGAAIPLALALDEAWQFAVLAGAAILLLVLRRGVVLTLLVAGAAGVALALSGAAIPL